MVFCDHPTLDAWSPDFSTSGLANPTWTRAKCGDVELCNSLEWAGYLNSKDYVTSDHSNLMSIAPGVDYVEANAGQNVTVG
jgi:hypothetical protein